MKIPQILILARDWKETQWRPDDISSSALLAISADGLIEGEADSILESAIVVYPPFLNRAGDAIIDVTEIKEGEWDLVLRHQGLGRDPNRKEVEQLATEMGLEYTELVGRLVPYSIGRRDDLVGNWVKEFALFVSRGDTNAVSLLVSQLQQAWTSASMALGGRDLNGDPQRLQRDAANVLVQFLRPALIAGSVRETLSEMMLACVLRLEVGDDNQTVLQKAKEEAKRLIAGSHGSLCFLASMRQWDLQCVQDDKRTRMADFEEALKTSLSRLDTLDAHDLRSWVVKTMKTVDSVTDVMLETERV